MIHQMASFSQTVFAFQVSLEQLEGIDNAFNCASVEGDLELILDCVRVSDQEDKLRLIDILGLDPDNTIIPDSGYLVFFN